MSKLINGKLKVLQDKEQRPARICWQGRWLAVTGILERWYDAGKWWEGEPARLFYRIQLQEARVWEIYREGEPWEWILYKIYD